MNILDTVDNKYMMYREKLLSEIKTITVWHWVRLGICFGLLRWFDFAARMIIAGRGVEHAMTIYQMGLLDKTSGTTMVETVGDIYITGFVFESIFIFIFVFGVWIVLVSKFGFPRRLKL